MPDYAAATAGDPLQPLVLGMLRMTMTPEDRDGPLEDQEVAELDRLTEHLDLGTQRRLAFFAVSVLSVLPEIRQAEAMNVALEMELPVTWRRAPAEVRDAFGQRS